MSGVVCVVCPFADDGKLKIIHVNLALLVWGPTLLPTHAPLTPWTHPPPSFFFSFAPPPTSLSFPSIFPLFPRFVLVLFLFFSFFLPRPPPLFFPPLCPPFVCNNFYFFSCWCVCACIFVCMCVRIWQFHVCRPMITSVVLRVHLVWLSTSEKYTRYTVVS